MASQWWASGVAYGDEAGCHNFDLHLGTDRGVAGETTLSYPFVSATFADGSLELGFWPIDDSPCYWPADRRLGIDPVGMI